MRPSSPMLLAFIAVAAALGVVPRGHSQAPQPPQLPDNFAEMQKVTEWSLMVSVRQRSGGRGRDGEGLTIYSTSTKYQHQSADGVLALQLQGPAAMMRMNIPPHVVEQMKAMKMAMPDVPTNMPDLWQWASIGRGELLINDRSRETHTHSGQSETSERIADGEMPVELALKINFTKKTYSLSAKGSHAPRLVNILKREFTDSAPIELVEREIDPAGVVTERRTKKVVDISVNDQPLPAKGTTLEGRIRRTRNRVREEITWRLEPKTKLPRVQFERADDSFLPEPNAVAGVRVRWDHGKPDEIVIKLANISREPGTCLNSADQSRDDDVAFASGQANLTVRNHTATANGPVTRVNLLTTDYAAYADITVSARFDRVWVVGKSSYDDSEVVSLVPDDDKNQISDFWQTLMDAENKPAEWDEDAAPKTATKKGDGLTLFEEYRGMFVAGGTHRRLDPRQMELVLIDPDKLFEPGLWRQVTGAGAVVITDTQHQGQSVNFNSRYHASQPKYAVMLQKVVGLTDLQGTAIGNYIWGQTTAVAVADGPATCRIFVDRPREELLAGLLHRVQNALANPVSPDGVELYGYGYNATLLQRVERALNNDAQFKKFLERVIRHIVVHELVHACDVEHHAPDTEKGVMNCPMRNFSRVDKFYRLPMEYLNSTSSTLPLGNGKLCTTGDNCAGHFRLAP